MWTPYNLLFIKAIGIYPGEIICVHMDVFKFKIIKEIITMNYFIDMLIETYKLYPIVLSRYLFKLFYCEMITLL